MNTTAPALKPAAAPAAPPPRLSVAVKAMPGKLREGEQTAFKSYDYETTHPWSDIFGSEYWNPISRWFVDQATKSRRWLPCTIRIFRPVQPEGDILGKPVWWEHAVVVVTHADERRVSVEIIQEPVAIGAPAGVSVSWPTETAKGSA